MSDPVNAIFQRAAFIKQLGIVLDGYGEGWCETRLPVIESQHLQQDDFVHAGVVATLADHTAGASTYATVKEDEFVLTVEYKVNFLRPAVGDSLRCRAEVLRSGRTLIVSESEVYACQGESEKLVAKSMMTLAVMQRPKL